MDTKNNSMLVLLSLAFLFNCISHSVASKTEELSCLCGDTVTLEYNIQEEGIIAVEWRENGKPIPSNLADIMERSSGSKHSLTVLCSEERNRTVYSLFIHHATDGLQRRNSTLLLVQGSLPSVSNLTIDPNGTTLYLTWDPPHSPKGKAGLSYRVDVTTINPGDGTKHTKESFNTTSPEFFFLGPQDVDSFVVYSFAVTPFTDTCVGDTIEVKGNFLRDDIGTTQSNEKPVEEAPSSSSSVVIAVVVVGVVTLIVAIGTVIGVIVLVVWRRTHRSTANREETRAPETEALVTNRNYRMGCNDAFDRRDNADSEELQAVSVQVTKDTKPEISTDCYGEVQTTGSSVNVPCQPHEANIPDTKIFVPGQGKPLVRSSGETTTNLVRWTVASGSSPNLDATQSPKMPICAVSLPDLTAHGTAPVQLDHKCSKSTPTLPQRMSMGQSIQEDADDSV